MPMSGNLSGIPQSSPSSGRDGALLINIENSEASSPPGNTRGISDRSGLHGGVISDAYRNRLVQGHATKMDTSRIPGIPKKSLLLIPARLAIALQADGWIIRQDIIWENPSGCESVGDRPSLSHDMRMLSKSSNYYFDADAIREPSGANCRSGLEDRHGSLQGCPFCDDATKIGGAVSAGIDPDEFDGLITKMKPIGCLAPVRGTDRDAGATDPADRRK